MPLYTTENIAYEEFKAINELRKAHPETHKGALRALLVFGTVLVREGVRDIELLEVVENWTGPRRVAFASTPEFPLRGRLTLYFLTPDEFEHPTDDFLPGLDISAKTLLHRVDQAYAILYEEPYLYAVNTMQWFDTTAMSPKNFFASLEPVVQP